MVTGEVDEAPRSFDAASLCYFSTPPPLSSKSSLSRGIKKNRYDVTIKRAARATRMLMQLRYPLKVHFSPANTVPDPMGSYGQALVNAPGRSTVLRQGMI